jgi:NAD-dependent deacetylase
VYGCPRNYFKLDRTFACTAQSGGMERLAAEIKSGRRVVFVTGAGVSVASGIKPYRATPDALWNVRDTKWCRIQTLLKDPARWYREFWLPEHHNSAMLNAKPNAAHFALEKVRAKYPNVSIVTQNVDRLHIAAATTNTTASFHQAASRRSVVAA